MRAGEFFDVFIPRTCAGCGTETVSLCADCVRALDTDPFAVEPRYGTLRVYGAGPYDGILRNVLIAYKESNRRDLVPVLADMLARAVALALADQPVSAVPVFLVPVPARAAAIRRRGANHVSVLAAAAARRLDAEGLRVRCADVLTVTGRGDQVGAGSLRRRGNVLSTHKVDPRAERVMRRWPGRVRVILVDDIVTTGATTAESARALRAFQIEPLAVSTVGITGGSSAQGTTIDE